MTIQRATRVAAVCAAWLAAGACGSPEHATFFDHVVAPPPSPPPGALARCERRYDGLSKTMFHGDRARTGWNARESDLTPDRVASAAFGPIWDSPPFDHRTIDGTSYPGIMYASPLYADDVEIAHTGTGYDGQKLSLVFAATTNGFVYAVNAFHVVCAGGQIPAGAFVWKTKVSEASVNPLLDGFGRFPALPLGVLGTPAIDLAASPPRIYVVSMDREGAGPPIWKAYALELGSGAILPGWPVAIDSAAVTRANTNGAAVFDPDTTLISQRAALNLSPAGDLLYVAFGGYSDHSAGWMVAVDTREAKVASSFCAAEGATLGAPNGGIWEPGGPAVDAAGQVYATAGNGPLEFFARRHAWGNSFLRWDRALRLTATYSPWNWCLNEVGDTDLGGDSPVLLPDLDPAETATPRLVAFGSKQGTVYLVDRDHVPGGTEQRPACALTATWRDAAGDTSLLPIAPQSPAYCDKRDPSLCGRGPLSVFGPYSDDKEANKVNFAKMRSTPAYFRGPGGEHFLVVAGSTKDAEVSQVSIPPSVARLRVNVEPGKPAFLGVDGQDTSLRFINPGSPVVSSDGARGAIAWVVDQNALRSQPILDPSTNHPVLYAVDAMTMKVLYASPNDRRGPVSGRPLEIGGKYVTPVVAHGAVFVGTDRIQAFGASL